MLSITQIYQEVRCTPRVTNLVTQRLRGGGGGGKKEERGAESGLSVSESGAGILSPLSPALIRPLAGGALDSSQPAPAPLPLAPAQARSGNLGPEDGGGDALTQLWIPWSLQGRPVGPFPPGLLGACACLGLGPEPAQLPVWLREEV